MHVVSYIMVYFKTSLLFIHRDEYPILLVANKVDLVHLRKISETEGRAMADRLNLPYMETSAKDPPQNIDGAFHEVLYYLLKVCTNNSFKSSMRSYHFIFQFEFILNPK